MPPIISITMSMSGRVTRPMASVVTSSGGTAAARARPLGSPTATPATCSGAPTPAPTSPPRSPSSPTTSEPPAPHPTTATPTPGPGRAWGASGARTPPRPAGPAPPPARRKTPPADPAAGHPRAERAGRDRRIDRDVSLRPGDLEVVAQRPVRGGQQRPAAGDIARAQQADGGQDAAILGDHVPGPAPEHRVRDLVHRRGVIRYVPQGSNAEDPGRLLAGAAPGRVPPVGQGVPHASVDDQQDQAGRREVERYGAALPAAAVQQHGMTGLAEQGGGLVHDPRRDPGELVLRPAGA